MGTSAIHYLDSIVLSDSRCIDPADVRPLACPPQVTLWRAFVFIGFIRPHFFYIRPHFLRSIRRHPIPIRRHSLFILRHIHRILRHFHLIRTAAIPCARRL